MVILVWGFGILKLDLGEGLGFGIDIDNLISGF